MVFPVPVVGPHGTDRAGTCLWTDVRLLLETEEKYFLINWKDLRNIRNHYYCISMIYVLYLNYVLDESQQVRCQNIIAKRKCEVVHLIKINGLCDEFNKLHYWKFIKFFMDETQSSESEFFKSKLNWWKKNMDNSFYTKI